MEIFTGLLSSGVCLDYPLLSRLPCSLEVQLLHPLSIVRSDWYSRRGFRGSPRSLFCQSLVQNSAHFMDEKKIDEDNTRL